MDQSFSSIHAVPAALLTKLSSLMPGSQSGTKSNQPEQDAVKHSELSVSLAECHLRVIWEDSLQAFWLFKMTVISHETTGEISIVINLSYCP